MIETSKSKAGGSLEEIKVVLGWVYNTLTLCVSLPDPKFISSTKTIQGILSKDKTKSKNLETLIGRINPIASTFLLERHLLARIRYFNLKMNDFAWYQILPNIRNKLKLHMNILQKDHKGILMNLLTYCEPTRIYLTNAREIGM